jgi:hypothetical protein
MLESLKRQTRFLRAAVIFLGLDIACGIAITVADIMGSCPVRRLFLTLLEASIFVQVIPLLACLYGPESPRRKPNQSSTTAGPVSPNVVHPLPPEAEESDAPVG